MLKENSRKKKKKQRKFYETLYIYMKKLVFEIYDNREKMVNKNE